MDKANEQGAETVVADSQTDSGEQDSTDWKAKAIEYETKYKAENGIRRRLEKDLKQTAAKTAESQSDAQPQDKKGFDYGQLAYLESKGYSDPADQSYLEQLAKESGTELRELLGKSWVQAELKERKDLRMADAATPAGSKRAGNSAADTVEYWTSKIYDQKAATLKDIPDRTLRQKVVNARLKKETQTDVFYDSK